MTRSDIRNLIKHYDYSSNRAKFSHHQPTNSISSFLYIMCMISNKYFVLLFEVILYISLLYDFAHNRNSFTRTHKLNRQVMWVNGEKIMVPLFFSNHFKIMISISLTSLGSISWILKFIYPSSSGYKLVCSLKTVNFLSTW